MSFDISRFWLHALLATVVGAGLAAPSVLRAEDADDAVEVEEDDVGDEDDEDEEKTDANDKGEDEEELEDVDLKKNSADPYAVPEDATNKELAAFIQELQTSEPDVQSREEYVDHMTRKHTAIVAASDKILSTEPEADAEGEALKCKLSSMWMLRKLDLPGAAEAVKTLAEELKDDNREDLASDARLYLFAGRMRTLDAKKPKEIKSLIADVNAVLKKPNGDPRLGGLTPSMVMMIEMSGANQLALEACKTFAATLAKGKDQQFAEVVEELNASARKLGRIGSPIEIEGTLVGGETFNWADYKGKVVLVDFWATWCGPCVEEIPNVKETYKKYQKQGFEVIGISLDDLDNREGLETFLADNEIPWPSLFGTEEEASGMRHPMAVKYEVKLIPTAILVDRKGDIVTFAARGERLPKLVAELIGPEEEPAEEKPAKKTKPAKAKPAKPAATKADDGEAAEEKPAAPKATPAKPAKKKPAPKE